MIDDANPTLETRWNLTITTPALLDGTIRRWKGKFADLLRRIAADASTADDEVHNSLIFDNIKRTRSLTTLRGCRLYRRPADRRRASR